MSDPHPDDDPQEGEWSSILLDSWALVHGDRGAVYGPPWEDYERVVDTFAGLTGNNLSIAEGLLFMVSMKLSRIAHGIEQELPPEQLRDSITDAAGYLDCLWGALTASELVDDDDDDDDGDDEPPPPPAPDDPGTPINDGDDPAPLVVPPVLAELIGDMIDAPFDDDIEVDTTPEC